MAGLSQRDVVLSQRAEEQLEQQKRDEELARRLQDHLDFEEDQNTKLAREAQDMEYARKIYEKEQAKLKRAKERKKHKKMLEKQQEQPGFEPRTESRTSGHHPQRYFDPPTHQAHPSTENLLEDLDENESVISAPTNNTTLNLKLPARKPYMNTGAIDSHQSSCNDIPGTSYGTMAAAASSNPPIGNNIPPNHLLDHDQDADESELSEPQYANVGPNANSGMQPMIHVRQTSDDGLPIPPYMPMQQQMNKRSTSLEKRIKKKKEKEGCKQQ